MNITFKGRTKLCSVDGPIYSKVKCDQMLPSCDLIFFCDILFEIGAIA